MYTVVKIQLSWSIKTLKIFVPLCVLCTFIHMGQTTPQTQSSSSIKVLKALPGFVIIRGEVNY